MVKLTYSSDISDSVGVGGEIVKSASDLKKQASTIFNVEYDALKAPEGKTGIHLVALGDMETYGFNRNADGFKQADCRDRCDTFVKFGHVYQHHRNKDPEKALGEIKCAAYNPDMHRVELYIWADNEKAKDHLERLEKTGEVSFSMACFRAGTLITTAQGCKPIEDIAVGDVVLTHTGSWKRVTATTKRRADGYYRIRPESRRSNCTLEVTAEHPLLSTSYKDIKFKARRDSKEIPSLKVCRSKRRSLDRSLAWKPVKDLGVRDFIVTPVPKRDIPGVDPISDINDARLLGYYLAEGSVSQGTVIFTCNIHDVAVKEIPDLRKWSSVRIDPKANSEKAVSVICHGGSPEKYFTRLVGRRCESKIVPAEIFAADDNVKLNFIAAWFNGDGWQDKDGLHVSTSNPGLADQLTMLLSSVGIESSSHYILHPAGRGLDLPENTDHVVNISNYYSGIFAGISKAVEIPVARKQSHAFIAGSYLMNPVKSIEYVDEETDVYNFSVTDDESYVANGFAVHNCTVPSDTCSLCGATRTGPGDKNECEHIKYQLGKIAEDGKFIGMINNEPKWFDISFVGRPADRIAWSLKTASGLNDPVKQAEYEGVVAPDELMVTSERGLRKLALMKELAAMDGKMRGWLKKASFETSEERRLFEMRKLAALNVPDSMLNDLRAYKPRDAFEALADAGVVLGARSFFKYAMGPDYKAVRPYMDGIEKTASEVLSKAVSEGTCSGFCNSTEFDVYDRSDLRRRPLPSAIVTKLAAYGCDNSAPKIMDVTLSGKTPTFDVDANHENSVSSLVSTKLAEKYVAYKLAAVDAVLNSHYGANRNKNNLAAISAAQDLKLGETDDK